MRRALRVACVAAVVAVLLAAASGARSLSLLSAASGPAATIEVLGGAPRVVHAAAGHLAAVLTALVASMVFVLGLQGLLESGGRRATSALLFVSGPILMWLVLAAESSGRIDSDAVEAGLGAAELEAVSHGHVFGSCPALAGATVLVAALVFWETTRQGKSQEG